MSNLKIFEYQGFVIEFEEINGQIMANATSMAKPFNKQPDDIFKTKMWRDFEKALIEDSELRYEDLRTVKNGDNGCSWIHQELIVEFARRLKPSFAVLCNRKIAEWVKKGNAELKPMTEMQMLQKVVNAIVDQEKNFNEFKAEVKEEIKELKAHQTTSPQNYFAVSGYASYYKINVDTNTAKTIGKHASKMCKDLGYVMGSVPDARYGSVKTYPIDVLETVFRQINLTR